MPFEVVLRQLHDTITGRYIRGSSFRGLFHLEKVWLQQQLSASPSETCLSKPWEAWQSQFPYIPAMDHIDKYMATACQNMKNSKAIRSALTLGKQTLNRYYNKTDQSDVCRIAMGSLFLLLIYFNWISSTVLHPHHKLQYFKKAGWKDSWIKTSSEIVCMEFD